MLHKRAEAGFTLAKCFFGALAIVDISALSIPLDNLSRCIALRHISDQQPAILPFGVAHTSFRFHRLTRCERLAPGLYAAGPVVSVNCVRPTPTQRLLQGETGELQPA